MGRVDVAHFLTARTDARDCQRPLDTFYGDDLLGKPSGAGALRGFEEVDSRLVQQAATSDKAALDESLARLRTLPRRDRLSVSSPSAEPPPRPDVPRARFRQAVPLRRFRDKLIIGRHNGSDGPRREREQ